MREAHVILTLYSVLIALESMIFILDPTVKNKGEVNPKSKDWDLDTPEIFMHY